MPKKLAVVVIPIYQETLDVFEQASLTQAARVLKNYDFAFLAPEGLLPGYIPQGIRARVMPFPRHYFQDKNTYSELMLLPELYERFAGYEYMLVYQLDAFVFSDRLREFCALGYDYIGAPELRYAEHWRDMGNNVGNGGLSLRKVSSCLRVVRQKENIYPRFPRGDGKAFFEKWEDTFFAFCATLKDLDFHTPPVRVALDFSTQKDIGHAYARQEKELPFGTHAFHTLNYWHWRPIIARFGYDLPPAWETGRVNARLADARRGLYARLLRDEPASHLAACARAVLPAGKEVSLWGGGKVGTRVLRFLHRVGVPVKAIYDKKAREGELLLGVPVREPAALSLGKEFLIVSSTKYAEAIGEELLGKGISREDFMEWYEFVRQILLAHDALRRGQDFTPVYGGETSVCDARDARAFAAWLRRLPASSAERRVAA